MPPEWSFARLSDTRGVDAGIRPRAFLARHLQFVRELRAVANNLNQLARHANAVAHAASVTELERALDSVTQILKVVRYDRKNR